MLTLLEKALQNYPRPYLTDTELKLLLGGTPDSRYGKVKRMLAQHKLLHIRRGLYCITNEIGYLKKPSKFELAQYIYGPSYISLESALSYHQLIPEAVYTTTSASGKRFKEFETPFGIFNYRQVPLADLYTEVTLIKENEQSFFIAKPWRAICDYIYCYRMNWDSLQPLLESLRLNMDNLPLLQKTEIQSLDDYYHQRNISRFLKGIQKELNQLKKISEM